MDLADFNSEPQGYQLEAAYNSLAELASDSVLFMEKIASQLKFLWPDSISIKRRGLFNTGKINELFIKRPDAEFSLSVESGVVVAKIGHVSGGVTISRQQVDLDQWIRSLLKYLNDELERNIKVRQVLYNLIN
jgi:hypothetical protein